MDRSTFHHVRVTCRLDQDSTAFRFNHTYHIGSTAVTVRIYACAVKTNSLKTTHCGFSSRPQEGCRATVLIPRTRQHNQPMFPTTNYAHLVVLHSQIGAFLSDSMSHLRKVTTYKCFSNIDGQGLRVLSRGQSQVIPVHQSADLLPNVLGLL